MMQPPTKPMQKAKMMNGNDISPIIASNKEPKLLQRVTLRNKQTKNTPGKKIPAKGRRIKVIKNIKIKNIH